MKDLVKRMLEKNLSDATIAYILEIDESDVSRIINNNYKRPTNAVLRQRPSVYPNSFFITRFKQGRSVKEVAEELNCNLAGLYRLLHKRGINPYTYYTGSNDDANNTHTY